MKDDPPHVNLYKASKKLIHVQRNLVQAGHDEFARRVRELREDIYRAIETMGGCEVYEDGKRNGNV